MSTHDSSFLTCSLTECQKLRPKQRRRSSQRSDHIEQNSVHEPTPPKSDIVEPIPEEGSSDYRQLEATPEKSDLKGVDQKSNHDEEAESEKIHLNEAKPEEIDSNESRERELSASEGAPEGAPLTRKQSSRSQIPRLPLESLNSNAANGRRTN